MVGEHPAVTAAVVVLVLEAAAMEDFAVVDAEMLEEVEVGPVEAVADAVEVKSTC